MYCQGASLLLLALFAAVVTSQNIACRNARFDLSDNRPCANAVMNMNTANHGNTSINRNDLNIYCSPDCRALNNRVVRVCSDPNSPMANGGDVTALMCSADGAVSCFNFIRSTQFRAAQATFEASTACKDDGLQTCSASCVTAIQNYLNVGGCCLAQALEFARQFNPHVTVIEDIVLACPAVNPPENTCQVIGQNRRSNGHIATGSALLIAAIILTVL